MKEHANEMRRTTDEFFGMRVILSRTEPYRATFGIDGRVNSVGRYRKNVSK